MKKMKFISVLLLSVWIVLSGCDTAGVSVEENVISENEITNTVENDDGVGDEKKSVREPLKTEYVANKNTRKLHYSWCYAVERMKEKNKLYLSCSRDEAVTQGYEPCKKCNP